MRKKIVRLENIHISFVLAGVYFVKTDSIVACVESETCIRASSFNHLHLPRGHEGTIS